jgi:hypothetical protein
VKKSTLYPCPSAKLSTPSYPNSSKYLTTPIQLYDIEVSHIKTMEKKLKRRQGVEQEVERDDKELKSKEEDQEKRVYVKRRRSREESLSQEDESVRPHDLEFIHPTSQPSRRISLSYFC